MPRYAQPPTLLFEREVIPTYADWVAMPSFGNGQIAVVGSGDCQQRENENVVPVSVLQVLAETGDTVFRFESHGLDGQPIETSNLCVDLDGNYMLAIYEHNVCVRLVRVSPTGQPLQSSSIEEGDPFVAWDVGTKLMLTLLPDSNSRFLLSWMYRQVREFGTYLRSHHGAAPIWQCPERLVGASDSRIVGVETPRDGAAIVCRSREDGAEAWRASFLDYIVAGVTSDALVVVDRSAQLIDRQASEKRLIECADKRQQRGEISEKEQEAQWQEALDYLPHVPATVRVLSLADGSERWSQAIDGDVLDIVTDEAGLSVLGSTRAGDGICRSFDWSGTTTGEFGFAGRVRDRWPTDNDEFRFVARTDELVIWANGDTLHAHQLGASGRQLWKLPLPAPCKGFRRTGMERALPSTTMTLGHELLALRDGSRLWVYRFGVG